MYKDSPSSESELEVSEAHQAPQVLGLTLGGQTERHDGTVPADPERSPCHVRPSDVQSSCRVTGKCLTTVDTGLLDEVIRTVLHRPEKQPTSSEQAQVRF